MSNAIEIEAKALISKADYLKLIQKYKDNPRYMQTNYYIDTEDRLLAKSGIALRVREKQGVYELTLKTPLSQGLLEKNAPITMNEFATFRDFGDFPKGDTARFLTMLDFDVKQLQILTSLSTERIDIELDGGLLSIDRNAYSGHTDYEVEYEFNNLKGAEEKLAQVLQENGIPVNFSKATKAQRAMAAIGK